MGHTTRNARIESIARRTQLVRLLGAGLATTGLAAVAQDKPIPPSVKPAGPNVWLAYEQAQLDDAYDQRVWASNMMALIKRGVTNSAIALNYLPPKKVWRYGEGEHQTIEGFIAPGVRNAPVHIFVRGGAWIQGSAAEYAYLAENFIAKGIHFLAVDFPNVSQVGGNLAVLGQSVRDAIAWVARHAQEFGGDPNRLFISGHSSGGHLAAVALTTDWQSAYGLAPNLLKGAVLISGLYDLKPVRLSARSSYIKFTDETEQNLSPQRFVDRISTPITLSYGSLDSPEFQRQSRDFAAALQQAGKSVEVIEADNFNHFEMVESLASPFGFAGRAALRHINTYALPPR